MERRIFCIIVSYNSMKWIDRCLGSLQASDVPVETIMIDNGSKDGTIDYVKKHFPEVLLIENKHNKGFGQANNQGLEIAYKKGATHFFLLNHDAWICHNTLPCLMEVQDKYDLAIASPIHLNGVGDLMDSNFADNIVFKCRNIQYISDLVREKLRPYYEADFINAAAWMLSRNTIETIGGFDPVFFHYGEDSHYIQRVFFHHGIVGFVPNSFVHHDRKLVGNIQVFNKRYLITKYLQAYTDINDTPNRMNYKKIKCHLRTLKFLNIGICSFNWFKIRNVLSSLVEFYRLLPTIKQHNKNNKIKQPNWLNLN